MATERGRAKADRQAVLLREAARLFADRGYSGVSIEELGAAAGVSGPAVYRHFPTKQALLGAILVRTSEELRDGGVVVMAAVPGADERLDALIAFHVDFALRDADVIRVHDRDLGSLADDDRHLVRRLQREYVEAWVTVLAQLHPALPDELLRMRAHAVFGLINSTPYSVGAPSAMPTTTMRDTLTAMAGAALRA